MSDLTTTQQQYNTIYSAPLEVLRIFNEFFGEEFVDLQGFPKLENFNPSESPISQGFILVHFPKVRITNEYDKYEDITHLYAKIKIDIEGKMIGRFLLNRSEYTRLHLLNDYMHSHIAAIPTTDFTRFQVPCTGTGPINRTIASLNAYYNEQLWQLFCLELSKYVEVESISGTPYHRLENITDSRSTYTYKPVSGFQLRVPDSYFRPLSKSEILDFVIYLVSKKVLKFKYINNCYTIANFKDTIIIISNCFIEWANKRYRKGLFNISLSQLLDKGVVSKVIIKNGKFYTRSGYSRIASFDTFQGCQVCTFKGKPVTINILDLNRNLGENENNDVYLLNPTLISFILSQIITFVNCKYGDQNNESDKEVRIV